LTNSHRPLIASVIAALATGSTSFAAPATYLGPIVDVHVHVAGVTAAGDVDWYSPMPPNPYTGQPTAKFRNEDDLLRYLFDELQRNRVVVAVVSNTPYHANRAANAYPTMVLPALALAPGEPYNYDVAEVREEIRAGRVKVLGEVFPQFYGRRITDPAMEAYYALAEEMDVPIGIHTGVAAAANEIEAAGLRSAYRGDFGNPAGLEQVLNRHPKLRLYLMHAGHPYFAETCALLQSYPNVYVDLAYISANLPRNEFRRYVQGLMEAIPDMDKRLMFGSDVMVWREGIRASIEAIDSLDFLTPAQKADVFCNNAARFLRLDARTCTQ